MVLLALARVEEAGRRGWVQILLHSHLPHFTQYAFPPLVFPLLAFPHFALVLASTSTFCICLYWPIHHLPFHLLHFHYLPFHNSHTASWQRGGASGRRNLDAVLLPEYENVGVPQGCGPTFSSPPPTYVSPPCGLP